MSGDRKHWHMRSYREGDETAIRELFALVFGRGLSADQWNWSYRDNGSGRMAIALAEGDTGELAGHYALRPVRMKIGNEHTVGTLSLDTMVHPDYRRQGMFKKLANYVYDEVAAAGIPLTYGFPNENSYHGLVNSLGWVELGGRLPLFVRVLKSRSLVEAKMRVPGLTRIVSLLVDIGISALHGRSGRGLPTGFHLRRVTEFDPRLDDFWRAASTNLEIAAVRDANYLTWRYSAHPTEDYDTFVLEDENDTVRGFLVLKTERRFGISIGYIVDLLTTGDRSDLDEGLIHEAVRYFRERDVDVVNCLMLEDAPFARVLRKVGFFVAPKRLLPQQMYLCVKRHTDEFPTGYLENPSNWYVTWGDHDVA